MFRRELNLPEVLEPENEVPTGYARNVKQIAKHKWEEKSMHGHYPKRVNEKDVDHQMIYDFFIPLPFNKFEYKYLGCVRLGSIRNKNNWNNASKRLFGSYSHSGIPGFPFRLFCPSGQNSQNIFRNIFLFRNIPNERALRKLNTVKGEVERALCQYRPSNEQSEA